MIANSSRVTWHSAGFCTEVVMVLMSCGRTRSGDRIEREPMAFMEDWFKGFWVVILGMIWSKCLLMKASGSIFILARSAGQRPDCTATKDGW